MSIGIHVLDLSWNALIQLKLNKELSGELAEDNLAELIETSDISERDIIPLNWNMHQIFTILKNNEEADNYLENAYIELRHQSKRIKNKKSRIAFLNKIKLHRHILEQWKM